MRKDQTSGGLSKNKQQDQQPKRKPFLAKSATSAQDLSQSKKRKSVQDQDQTNSNGSSVGKEGQPWKQFSSIDEEVQFHLKAFGIKHEPFQ